MVLRLLLAVAFLLAESGLKGTQASVVAASGLSGCSSRALEHRLDSCGALAYLHVGSSWIRDRTCVSCIGRQILNH